jgi:2-hydroxy fatty acid dioxygenase
VQATNTPDLALPSQWPIPDIPINLGTAAAALYSFLYVLMEPVAGGMIAPLILGAGYYGSQLTATYGATANLYALGIHVAAWIFQFIGHGKFEGRAPALLDNLVQALFLAPLFVWLEILFYFGYRPELRARIEKSVQAEISKFNQAKQANGSANGKAK